MKLIGSELISDDVVAVTELVKNAHDADASSVRVEFRNTTEPGGEILIIDDGVGMDLDTLLTRWMEPAGSWKQTTRRTAAGRRVLGEKGVGRFASDKLGAELEVISRPRKSRTEIKATIDWDRFATQDHLLSDIEGPYEVRKASVIATHGTMLRISGLRSRWTERMFRRLSTRLSRLISPFEGTDGFSIIIDSDEYPQYSGRLRADLLDRAPHRINARFDGRQGIEVRMGDGKSVTHRWNGAGALRCGPVQVRLFAFDLETSAVARVGPRMEVRAWLREWSGASIYRDGFRIWPYGEPHDDWLRLDQRRVNNPTVRLSNNQIVGFVDISSDENPDLRDQTNREGLIHNEAFEDLRRLMYFVLQHLEAERQLIRHPRTREIRASGSTDGDSLVSEIERLASRASGALGSELRGFKTRLEKELTRQNAEQERVLSGYADLAALGQAAVGVETAVRPALHHGREVCASLYRSTAGPGTRALKEDLRAAMEALEMAEERLAMMSHLGRDRGRRRRTIDLSTAIEDFVGLAGPLLEAADVAVQIDVPRRGTLRAEMSVESFNRLLNILTMNAVEWMGKRGRRRQIRIQASGGEGNCTVHFTDSGPGVSSGLADRVFEPLVSGREGGRGMGLTIARTMVRSHGGDLSLSTDGRRRGACFIITLPRKRSRATA